MILKEKSPPSNLIQIPVSFFLIFITLITLIIFIIPGKVYAEDKDIFKLELTDDEKAWLEAHPRIVLGGGFFMPLDGINQSGRVQGIGPDYTDLIANILGIEFEYVSGDWAEIQNMAREKKIDGIRLAAKNIEREKYLEFSIPYTKVVYGILTRKHEDTINSLKDLPGRTVTVLNMSVEHMYLKKKYPDIKLLIKNSYDDLVNAVLMNEADAAIGATSVLAYTAQEKLAPGVKVRASIPELDQSLYMAVRKDWPQLVTIINKALSAITPEQHQKIRNRWINIEILSLQPQSGVKLTQEEKIWIQEHPIIQLGFNPHMEPLLIKEKDGSLDGIYPEIFDELERVLSIKFLIEVDDWHPIVEKVRERKLDGLLACAPSQANASSLIRSKPIHMSYPAIFIRHDAPFHFEKMADLIGKKIIYQREVKMLEVVLEPYRENSDIVAAKSTLEALGAVLDGRADIAIGVNFENYLVAKHALTGIKMIYMDLEHENPISTGIRDDWPQLVTIINKGLDYIGQEKIQKILVNWTNIERKLPHFSLSPEEKEWLKEHPVIRVGTDSMWAPIEFLDKNGTYNGLAIEYLNHIENKLGIRFEFVKEDWQQLIINAKNRELDLFTCVASTPERNTYLTFTEPYIQMPSGIFSKKGVNYISDLNLLNDKKIAVVGGYAIHDYLAANYSKIDLLLVKNPEQGIQAVLKGNAFAYIDNIITTGYLISQKGYLDINMIGEFPFVFSQSMGVRKDWPIFRDILQKAIDEISAQERTAIYNRWVPLIFEKQEDFSLFWKIGLVILGIIVLSIFWNRRLAIAVRKRTNALRVSEQKFRSVYEFSRDAIVIIDTNTIIDCNAAALEMFGYIDKEEFSQNHLADVSPEVQPDNSLSRQKAHEVIELALNGKGEIFEWTYKRKNGSNFPTEISLSPLKWEKKEVVQAIIRDIADRKKAEIELEKYQKHLEKLVEERTRQLKEAQDQLIQSEKMASLGILTAGIAHEINNPLNFIQTGIMAIQKELNKMYGKINVENENNSEEVKECLHDLLEPQKSIKELIPYILTGCTRIKDIVKELNLYSRKEKDEKSRVNINHCLDSALMILYNLYKENIHIIKNYSDIPDFYGYSGRITQVFINLFKNAIDSINNKESVIKYSGNNGELSFDKKIIITTELITKNECDYILISIEDNGGGIPSKNKHKIFDPFFTTKEPGQGTGLGLSISLSIIKNNNGELSFISNNKGAIFKVLLPGSIKEQF